MNKKHDKIEGVGIVRDIKPNGKFDVEIEGGHIIEVHLSGKMRQNKLQIVENDAVVVHISVYDPKRGILVDRLEKKGE